MHFRHSRRAKAAVQADTISEETTMSHSSRPLPLSGSTPNTVSIQLGHIRVALSSTELTLNPATSSQNRPLKCRFTACPRVTQLTYKFMLPKAVRPSKTLDTNALSSVFHLWTPPFRQGKTLGSLLRVVGCCHLSGL